MQRSSSPTLTGFQFMFRRPSLGLAEMAWRWSFGFAGSLLLAFSLLEFLNTLPVSAEDMLLFRSRQPFLITQAINHILRGSAPRVVDAMLVLGLAMLTAWIVVASLGRSVTLRAASGYLFEEASSVGAGWGVGSLAGLNFLRVATTFAAVLGVFAAGLIAGAVTPDDASSAGAALLIFLAVTFLVWFVWVVLNWLFSFAAVFVVVEGQDAFGAVAAALHLRRGRVLPVFVASLWFGLAHGVALLAAGVAVAFPLVLANVLPPGIVLLAVLLVALIYFAVADFLYMGRLAAYVAIVEGPEPLPITKIAPSSFVNQPPVGVEMSPRVDPEELILSDLPASEQP